MNSTIRLADEVPRVIQEILPELVQEEVVRDDALRSLQLALRSLKVELDVELLEEARDGVRVLALLELHDLDELADRVAHARAGRCAARRGLLGLAREHGGDGEVAEDPGRSGLDGVEVRGGEECLEEEGAARGVVEVDEERPVDEPCAGVQGCKGLCGRRHGGGGGGGGERGGGSACVDGVAEGIELFKGDLPLAGENVRSKFAPVGGGVEICVGGEDAEMVEVICGARVVAVGILELAKVVERSYLLEGELRGIGLGCGRRLGGRRKGRTP